MQRLDTTEAARGFQMDAYRAMGSERRTELAVEMSEEIRLVTLDGLRERHPDAAESEINFLLVELWHGPELAALVRSSTCPGR